MKRELQVRRCDLLYANRTQKRKVKVTLTNGTVIHIVSSYESWQQYGGTVKELQLTVPIANYFNNWLHGEDFENLCSTLKIEE